MGRPISNVTRHGQVTLPASVRKQRGIEVEDERAVLMPKKPVDKSQAYFWTKQWQDAEREADENIKAGRANSFDSADELMKGPDKA